METGNSECSRQSDVSEDLSPRGGRASVVWRRLGGLIKDQGVRVQSFLDGHEGKFLASTVALQAFGYTTTSWGVYSLSTGALDPRFGVALIAYNACSIVYNWGLRGYYGANSESVLRRAVRFLHSSGEKIWDDPEEGIDNLKSIVQNRAEKIEGRVGRVVQSAFSVYRAVRRDEIVGKMIHAGRIHFENNLVGAHRVYDWVSPYIPAEYVIQAPMHEYGKDVSWIYSGGINDNRRFRVLHRQ